MNLSKFAVKRPVTTAMLIMAVVVIGIVLFLGLSQDLFPDIELPVAIVMITYPNAGPEEVENLITIPIEQALATVEDLEDIYSVTSQGMSIVAVQFAMNTDMNFASLNMRESIALVEAFLPDDASSPMVLKMDISATPVVQMYISGDMELPALYALVEDDIGPAMERVSGVASVSISGGVEEEIAVTFQQERLTGYGLTLSTISQMLAAENINLPSGSVISGEQKLIVRTLGKFASEEEIASYPLTLPTREVIQLSDIATIERQYADQSSITRIDGNTAVGVFITKQSTANTVDVSDAAQKQIDYLRERYPQLTFDIGFDQADFIRASVSSVAESAVTGGILAIIVIFIFLKNINSTLVIGISIPTSLLATFILMNVAGMTLNMFTLTALTLAIGMLVDNSVVVLENIYRLNQESDDPQGAAIQGAEEVYLAVIASTVTSMVVYLPLALSNGMASLLFKDFCWTIIIALLASLLVSITAVPLLSSRLMRRQVSTDYIRIGSHRYRFRIIKYFTVFIEWLTIKYEKLIRAALKRRKLVVISSIVIFVISLALVGVIGMELMPETDEASFSVSIETPYGTSIAERDRIAQEVEEYLLAIPELKHLTVNISETSMMGASNTTSLSVTLVNKSEREASTAEIVRRVRADLPVIPGTDIRLAASSTASMMLGDTDISLMIQGTEMEVLEEISEDLMDRLAEIEGIAEVTADTEEGNPELRVRLNRNVAAHYGITAYQLANALGSALSGSTATAITIDGTEIDVVLQLNDTYHATTENMRQILIPSSTGTLVPVGQVAEFEFDNSPVSISRYNQLRTITVSVNVEGRDLGSVTQEVLALLNVYNFPDGYSYDAGGQQEEMIDAFGDLLLALGVAVLLVYMVLASQFESLGMPFIVMMSVPFAMSGAFFALFLVGMRLSIIAMTGLVMLVGIVVNNAIILIEFINQNKDSMDRDEAIALAGKTRLRPILITTITTCVGMIPLSIGSGDGGEIMAPIGVSVIGGLLASTLVTLILIPVLYAWVDDKQQKRKNRKEQKHDWIVALETKWQLEDEQHAQNKAQQKKLKEERA